MSRPKKSYAEEQATDEPNGALRPRIVRHRYSGVLIGYMHFSLGADGSWRAIEGDLPGTFKFSGRRIWSWSGGRLDTSQLATKGVDGADRLGDWVVISIASAGVIDLVTSSSAVVEVARKARSA